MNGKRDLALFLSLLLLATSFVSCGQGDASSAPWLPENDFTYAMSRILIAHDKENPASGVDKVLRVIEDLRSGMPFDEVARRRSEDKKTAAHGGWMGFVPLKNQGPFTGAVQALPPGIVSGPVHTEHGIVILYRHPFEEARELERRLIVPAYGFFVPWADREGEGPPKATAEARAKEARSRVQSGELTLEDAAREYSPIPSPRSDLFIGNLFEGGGQQEIYLATRKARPGELAPLGQVSSAFFVARRGQYFRSQVRHILIQHVESPGRPLSVSRTKAAAKAKAEEVRAELAGDPSKWADAVRRYSDEVGSIPTHGWLGAVTNGQLEPELEAAVLATEPGRIASEIVEAKEGFHIVYRAN